MATQPTQGFLATVNGEIKQLFPQQTSAGAADAGKLGALGPDGRWHQSMMPLGVGQNTVSATASEAIGAGKFVNYHSNAGVFSMRLADNSNGRPATGFVTMAVAEAEIGTAYPLDGVNAGLTGLTAGTYYYLGTAGGVIATPLDETDTDNVGKISQRLGIASSATELVTDDFDPVVL